MGVKPIVFKEVSENCSLVLRVEEVKKEQCEPTINVRTKLNIIGKDTSDGDWVTNIIEGNILIQWVHHLKYIWVLTELNPLICRKVIKDGEPKTIYVDELRGSISNREYLQELYNSMVGEVVRQIYEVPRFKKLEVYTRAKRKMSFFS